MKEELRARVKELEARGITPGLGTILVGDDPEQRVVRAAQARQLRRGRASRRSIRSCPRRPRRPTCSPRSATFNDNPAVDGFIVQLPLPPQCDEEATLRAVDPDKDADGLHPVNLGRLMMGVDAPIPCTPAGIQALLVHAGVPIEGRHVVIVGRGLTIGRPLGQPPDA